jgi:hypothetical protein
MTNVAASRSPGAPHHKPPQEPAIGALVARFSNASLPLAYPQHQETSIMALASVRTLQNLLVPDLMTIHRLG